MAKPTLFPQRSASADVSSAPPVRVEVRNGNAKPVVYDLTGEEFLIGSVPGCDLRLPGTSLPPVVCLITRQSDGVRLRKLAPTLPVLINGQPVSQNALTPLAQGDVVSIGAVDLHMEIPFQIQPAPQFVPIPIPTPSAEPAIETPQQTADSSTTTSDDQSRQQEWVRRQQELEQRQRGIEEKEQELEADRVLWYRRREEIERELRETRDKAERGRPDPETLRRETEESERLRRELDRRAGEMDAREKALKEREEEITKGREEIASGRKELNERFRERRDQLLRAQEAIRQAQEQFQKQRQAGEEELLRQRQETESELFKRRQQFEIEYRQRVEAATADQVRLEAELQKLREEANLSATELRQTIERENAENYRQRHEELDRLQTTLRTAAEQLRDRKQQFEADAGNLEPRYQEMAAAAVQLDRERAEFAARVREFEAREQAFAERDGTLSDERARAEHGFAQYQADLVRIDRLQTALEEKQRLLEARALEVDQRHEKFRAEGGDLEEHARQIESREEQLRQAEAAAVVKLRELEQRETQLNARAAGVESQQAMLTSLRARLEEMREDVRADVVRVADERARHEELSRESQERLREAERIRESLVVDRLGHDEGSKVLTERSALMQQAVARLRDLQEQLRVEDERLRGLNDDLVSREAKLAEEGALVEARSRQLLDLQHRLEADREAVRTREIALTETDGTRGALQEQLVRRSEDLAGRARELDDKARLLDEQARLLEEQADALEKLRADANSYRALAEGKTSDLSLRDEHLKLAEQGLAEERRRFDEARQQWERDQSEAAEKNRRTELEIAGLREALTRQAGDLLQQMPNLEQRAHAALERTGQAREQLRGQLAELHAYARQNQDEIESLRGQVQAEMERLRQQEASLNRSRSEHRLAVASFKQQLLEWQGRFGEMRQTLSRGETRIGQRAAEVEATSQQLAKQAEVIQVLQQEVTEKRGEVERHLSDMREWYRRKLRELVESKQGPATVGAGDSGILSLPAAASASTSSESRSANPVILSMADDLDPGDRRLGELLRSLELVDAETLSALWGEARRQRRPLRQVLLAGGYLTLYQLALIEADSLDKLVLGRFRVVDRLQHTSRESVYRAFDPQLASAVQGSLGTCLVRHLSDAEMHDPVHPDEYRQRFAAARDLAHPNIAATLEVLEINGRPAAVQEWLSGLPGGDWPALAGVPGVWYRLLSQAALGLHTAHQAGLIHGRLTANSFVLTTDGALKITGFGEPPWLMPAIGPAAEPSIEADLQALGQAALGWSQLNAVKTKRGKPKPFAPELLGVLIKLGADTGAVAEADLYPSAAALLEDLEQIGADIDPGGDAWEKLLVHAGENKSDGPQLRRSA